MFIDTHAHLTRFNNTTRQCAIDCAAAAGVGVIVCPAEDIADGKAALEIAQGHGGVFAAVGVHPHHAGHFPTDGLDDLEELARHEKVVAIGEIGLDFYRDLSPRPQQREVFVLQLRLAKKLGLPVIVHSRQSHEEVLEILLAEAPDKVVWHCFSAPVSVAHKVASRGWCVSFTGTVTYSDASVEREAARTVPLSAMMLETDSPFLAPEPDRKVTNQPAKVVRIADEIAALRQTEIAEIEAATTENAIAFFRLPAADLPI